MKSSREIIILLLIFTFLTKVLPLPAEAPSLQINGNNLVKEPKKPTNKWDCFNSSLAAQPGTNSTADQTRLPEWGGNCTQKDWDKCSHLRTWTTSYLKDRKHPEKGYTQHEIDCVAENWKCLCNGWTVTRCQLLCMRCNRDLLTKYDKYVTKEGPC